MPLPAGLRLGPDFEEDFEVLDYQCHPAIKAPVAV